MSKKIAVGLFLVVTIIVSGILPAYAIGSMGILEVTPDSIEPRWQNANSVVMKLDVSESPIFTGFTITGHAGTTYSNGTLTLEKTSGSHTGVLGTWTGLSSNNALFTFNVYCDSPLTAGQYRVTLTITATRNGVSEEIELSKTSVR